MAYTDPNARKEVRYRVNLNHYQAEAIEALARQHLDAYRSPVDERISRTA